MTVPVGLTARMERVLMESSVLIAERAGFSTEGFEDIGAVMGEAIPGPACSIYTRRISWVSEHELQEEYHLGKQPFVPKAILH